MTHDHQIEARRSQLFTVHCACTTGNSEPCEIRGKVQHVISGEWRYFRDWETLQTFLIDRVQISQNGIIEDYDE